MQKRKFLFISLTTLLVLGGLVAVFLFNKNGTPSRLLNYTSHVWESRSAMPDTLYLTIPDSSFHQLEAKRQHALDIGLLITSKTDLVPATLKSRQDSITIQIRLKGDWPDHLKNENWSFRIQTDTPWRGMRKFNIQSPETKQMVSQWLFFEAARAEGIIIPRSDFCLIYINDRPFIYSLEEHMDFPLLEANSRQKGPIVRYREDEPWDKIAEGIKWTESNDNTYFDHAAIDAFRTKKVERDSALKAMYDHAETLLNGFRNGSITSSEVFEIETTSRFLALSNLFGGSHGCRWHNMRFYYNPKKQKLEPIAFDTDPGKLSWANYEFEHLTWNKKIMLLFYSDVKMVEACLDAHKRIGSEEYLSNMLKQSKEDREHHLRTLYLDFPGYKFDEQELKDNSSRIRSSLKHLEEWHAKLDS